MRDYELAQAFVDQFKADAALAAAPVFAGCTWENFHAGTALKRPAFIFSAKTTPLNDAGTAGTYALFIEHETPADKRLPTDPDPALAHAARVEAVRQKLLGSGRAALEAALTAGTLFSFRGWSARDCELVVAERLLVTPLQIAGAVLLQPPIPPADRPFFLPPASFTFLPAADLAFA